MAENAVWSPVGGWGLLNGRLARVVDLLRLGQRYSVKPLTGDTVLTVLATSQYTPVDTTAGSVTVTLPPASDAVGRLPLIIKKVVAANTLTVQAQSGETIEGQPSMSWQTDDEAREFLSDGEQWLVLTTSFEQVVRYVTTVTNQSVTLSAQPYNQHVRGSGAINVTLPTAASMANRLPTLVSKAGVSGAVTVYSSGGTINGTTAVAITTENDARRFLSDGTSWYTV